MKTFRFKLYIKTQGQEFIVGQSEITAQNVDEALKLFHKKDLPFHHFSTIEKL
jgi:hypothetical protein